jgi:hypothetical protein
MKDPMINKLTLAMPISAKFEPYNYPTYERLNDQQTHLSNHLTLLSFKFYKVAAVQR